jgi:hypothetical protein
MTHNVDNPRRAPDCAVAVAPARTHYRTPSMATATGGVAIVLIRAAYGICRIEGGSRVAEAVICPLGSLFVGRYRLRSLHAPEKIASS